jgi:hypothetical protein
MPRRWLGADTFVPRHSAHSFEHARAIDECSSLGSRCFVSRFETVRFVFLPVVPFHPFIMCEVLGYASNRLGVTGRCQEVWSVSLSAHLWHGSAINVQTLTEADGKVGWGVYGSTWAYREGVNGGTHAGGMGRFTIAGRGVDESGNGVADLELQVGKQTVYTGATGEFELTVRKRNRQPPCPTPTLAKGHLLFLQVS